LDRFERVQTQVLGLSVDSVPCLVAWAESLEGITYPLLSDFYPHGKVAEFYGILRSDGKSERAIFVVDKRGVIRYVDVHDIDDQPDNEELFRVLEQIEPNPIEPAAANKLTKAEVAAEPDADVVLYCTPWCPACRKARAYLNEHEIEFVEIDVTRDRNAAQHLRNWTGGYETTPTFKVKGQIIINFDRDKLNKILDLE
jgi:glutaredoxin